MKKLIVILVAFALVFTACKGKKQQQAESSLDKIKAAGVLSIGTEGTYPPFSFHNEANELVGYDVEIAREIAKKLGVTAKHVESRWDSLIIGVDSGHWDTVINQVGINLDRQAKYDFSTPYSYSRGVLIVHNDNTTINTFSDLKGKKSAQTVTSNWAKLGESNGAEIVGTDGFNQSVDLVISGRADATINDDVTFYDYTNQHPTSPVKIVATSDDITANGAIIAKNQPELLAAINKALDELQKEGTLKAISEKYFGKDISVK
ncbi:amino acid ABC transporter substrate-binding protein [Spirochaetia bacterium]|nr:amino acid ABC transporter substrate-binding protein [Spirochaetia bacterium]